jgi:hypothetical protein
MNCLDSDIDGSELEEVGPCGASDRDALTLHSRQKKAVDSNNFKHSEIVTDAEGENAYLPSFCEPFMIKPIPT